ncbi:MAG: Rqc2 family fibronectin-binding protein [Anaerovoracaceae bacterium]|jgi:predicted ribosome quality control (RQC) complex YloA/Tae2 family protein
MSFDGVVTRAMAAELNSALCGSKVERIYQPERDELVFFLHTASGKKHFYASSSSSHAGIYLTDASFRNPPEPSAFCMLLRKHLTAARIVDIHQRDAERIIEIDFETFDEMKYMVNKRLLIEIMGKHSNIILIDLRSRRILDSIKRISIDVNRVRQILPGQTYQYPPDQGKIPFDEAPPALLERLRDDPDGLLAHIQGISPLIAREIAPDPVSRLSEILRRLRERDLTPTVYCREDGSPADFHVVPIAEYRGTRRPLPCDSVSAAVSYYFSHRAASNRVRQKAADLTRTVNTALKKLRLKRQRLGEDLLQAQQADKYQLYGELLTANLHAFQTGDRSVTVTNYYDGSDVTIPLDPRYAPSRNAQRYFKKYSKAKTALREKRIQLEETDHDITYLESVAAFLEAADDTDTIDAIREELTEAGFVRFRRRRKPPRRRKAAPYTYRTEDGFRILAGRNNRENDQLTFRTAGRHDLWFHTKDIPGSHVILFTEGRDVSEQAIRTAAETAAWHSKARASENVPVDYTEVRHVKKPNGARAGMCIFTDNHTLYVTPRCPQQQE